MSSTIGAGGRIWLKLLPRDGAHRYCQTRQRADGSSRWPACGGFLIFRPVRHGGAWRRCYLMFAEESWTSDRVRSLIGRWSILMRPTWQLIRRLQNPILDTKHRILATSEGRSGRLRTPDRKSVV